MNLKEINELRRRWRPDRSAVSRIYGCYVNSSHEIVSYLDSALGLLPQEDVEMYLERFKKVLGGSLGKNLIDIVFSTRQVADSDEHRLLTALRNSSLSDAQARETFYRKIMDSLDFGDDGYVILLAADSYDVPYRGRDGQNNPDASEETFTYFLCAVCPVRDAGLALRYFHDANEFHGSSAGQTVANPAVGFLFPAFDDRRANLYNALYYAQKPAEVHPELIDALFSTDMPLLSAAEQREAFHNALRDALGDECSYEALQTVHEQLRERIELHREIHDPEPLNVTAREVCDILESGGVSGDRLEAFERACGDHFGMNAVLNPGNLIDSKRFEINTPEARISVDPSCSYIVETRVIDGRKYLLIPADQEVTVNGMSVNLADGETVAGKEILAEIVPGSGVDTVAEKESGSESAVSEGESAVPENESAPEGESAVAENDSVPESESAAPENA